MAFVVQTGVGQSRVGDRPYVLFGLVLKVLLPLCLDRPKLTVMLQVMNPAPDEFLSGLPHCAQAYDRSVATVAKGRLAGVCAAGILRGHGLCEVLACAPEETV